MTTPPIRTTLRYDERAALDGATSSYQWNALVRRFVRVRNGEMPADWQAVVVDSGLYARVSARWPAPVCFGTYCPPCTPYRRRGPTWTAACEPATTPFDLLADTIACRDPRREDAAFERPVAGACMGSA